MDRIIQNLIKYNTLFNVHLVIKFKPNVKYNVEFKNTIFFFFILLYK